jgi:hypothetical protein
MWIHLKIINTLPDPGAANCNGFAIFPYLTILFGTIGNDIAFYRKNPCFIEILSRSKLA